MILPFPVPVNTKTMGQISRGSPIVEISSPTDIMADLALVREVYICDDPRERKGVEYPKLR